jgi:membrane associated rhomboid family serine protease
MARRRWLDRHFYVLGGTLTAPVALLIGVTLLSSILGAQIAGILFGGALVPGLVLQGEVWRLFTWPLFERDALSLIFALLALFWFGNDLVRIWGPVRFLVRYFALAGAAGVGTCLVALVWPALLAAPFVGPWAVVDAVIIAWAVSFPTRDIFLYFVVPLHGRNLVYATLGGTLLFALLGGIGAFVPHFTAELLTLALLRGVRVDRLWARARFELAYRLWRRRTSRLREVPPRAGDDSPRWYH